MASLYDSHAFGADIEMWGKNCIPDVAYLCGVIFQRTDKGQSRVSLS